MPIITVQKTEYSYNNSDVLSFDEGLIGLPEMRRAVLLQLPDFEPFCWLAALDNPDKRFLVVNPHQIFSNYQANVPGEIALHLEANASAPNVLAIVKLSSDWTKTTVNLRAPIFVNQTTKLAAQAVLSNTNYRLDESLPEMRSEN